MPADLGVPGLDADGSGSSSTDGDAGDQASARTTPSDGGLLLLSSTAPPRRPLLPRCHRRARYGYLTNTKVKFLMVTTDLDVKDADARNVKKEAAERQALGALPLYERTLP